MATLNSPFLDVEFLLENFRKYAPQCQVVEQMHVAPEFADKFPDRALKIYRFKFLADQQLKLDEQSRY
jgi:hypothetical protein